MEEQGKGVWGGLSQQGNIGVKGPLVMYVRTYTYTYTYWLYTHNIVIDITERGETRPVVQCRCQTVSHLPLLYLSTHPLTLMLLCLVHSGVYLGYLFI